MLLRLSNTATSFVARIFVVAAVLDDFRCYVFGTVNRETLVSKVVAYSAKLLHKADQCRALCTCAQLYWQAERPKVDASAASSNDPEPTGRGGGAESDGELEQEKVDEGSGEPVRNGASVLKTLKRALKTANALAGQLSFSRKANKGEQAAGMFVEILNAYLFFYGEGCPQITSKVLQDLVEFVVNEVGGSGDDGTSDAALLAFHQNTISHIRRQQAREGDLGARFSELSI